MKISEILKMVFTFVKYIFVFYLLINLVAYIYVYVYILQPKEIPRSKKQEVAFEFLIAGNALLYMLITDPSMNKNRSNSILPYNSVSNIHHTNGY